MKKIVLLILLSACIFLSADWQIDEGFEGGTIPAGWTIYDGDSGATWTAYENSSYSYEGNWSAFTDSYYPEDEDNWLILPQASIAEGDSVSLFIRSWYSTESFEILVSTTTNEISDFDDELISVAEQGTDYTHYSMSLSDYAGEEVYVGIHWECQTYGLLVDNVKLGQAETVELILELPDEISFLQNESFSSDFSEYFSGAEPEDCTLSVSGNQHITVEIDGFNVELSSLNWYGTEELTFSVEDNYGNTAEDVVSVIVEQANVEDIMMFEINMPVFLTCLDDEVQPIIQLINNGNSYIDHLTLTLHFNIYDESSELVFSTEQDEVFTLNPEEYQEVEFIETWTADEEGDYDLEAYFEFDDIIPENNQLTGQTMVREHFSSGGADDFGYRWLDNHTEDGPEFEWIDISETGESAITYNVPGFAGDDNFSEPVPIGFDFNFYGINYSEFYVDVNGELLFADNSWYEAYPSNGWDNDGNVFNWAYPIPGYSQMPALISVYWDDLEADQGTGDVYFQTFGEAPDRYCVIQWYDLRFHTGEGIEELLNFEVIIHESGDIKMQYLNTATGQTGSNAPHDHGQSATVAIQNETADIGLCYLQEQVEGSTWVGVEPEGNILTDGLAISFFTGEDETAPFLSHTPVGNTMLNSAELQVSIADMSGLSEDLLFYDLGNGWESISHTSFIEPNTYCYELNDLEPGSEIRYYFQAVDASPLENQANLPADAPDEFFSFKILPYADNSVMLAYSGYQDHTGEELAVWQDALNSCGISYDLYNWQEWQNVAIPDQYQTVFLFSNSCSHSEELDSLCVALMNWLDSGTIDDPRNLFFSSDGFAYSQSGHPNSSPMKKLWNAYFRTAYVGTTIGGGTNGLGGPDNLFYEEGSILVWNDSPIGNEGEELQVYANSPDCIFEYDSCPSWYEDEVVNPEIGSHNAFVFEDGPFNGQAYLYHGVCGTWIDNEIYKAFYFSFDFSQLTNETVREELIADCVYWFQISVESSETELITSPVSLKQNYPNPFIINNSRSTTSISFSAENASIAEIVIYDVKGRKVKSISKELSENCSEHSISWDGKDQNGSSVASNVYFYQLKLDGKFHSARKMVVIH